MAATEIQLVKDTTIPLVLQLLNAGVAVNLTGSTVALLLYDENGASVSYTGTVAINDATTGKVQFTPSAADFDTRAPAKLYARWKVTNGSQVSFYPSGERDVWRVYAS